MRHIMSPLDLSVDELEKLLDLANDIEKHPDKYAHACDGKRLATLFYDALHIKAVSKKEPRGTGEKILSQMDHPLAKIVLEYRGLAKLISTYIDKLLDNVNSKTGRIHCRFNQLGAKTGRFSSNDPNLQNIPSHNKDIRKMFKATDGYYMISADYSRMCAVLKCG